MQFEKDITSKHKELFLAARDLLLSYEGMTETKKPRITTYAVNGNGVCHMRTMPYGIDFGFLKGVKLQDGHGLLTGSGKVMRVLPIKGDLDERIVRHYVDQAVELAL